jgi:hypothetical protein
MRGRLPCVLFGLVSAVSLVSAGSALAQTPPATAPDSSMQMSMPMMPPGPLGIDDVRDGSGTSWLPDASPMSGAMHETGPWMLMLHGNAFLEDVRTTGARGNHEVGSVNWFMGMAERDVSGGRFTMRAMMSLDPLTVGKCGYPDLLQSGELCNGAPLHDDQHPHNLFMEVAVDYRHALSHAVAFEVYGGPVGEPALGPVAFPHRPSAMSNLMAPISHHWLDSTHVSFGVVTGALYGRRWKAESSVFNGREPDDRRYGFELAPLDSYSGRLSFLPSPGWALQVSAGHLTDAEARPDGTRQTVNRLTASATYHRLVNNRLWATTVAWGRNDEAGQATSAFLAETSAETSPRDLWFGRVEVVGKAATDLSLPFPSADVFTVGKADVGYTRWLAEGYGVRTGIGGSVGVSWVPTVLTSFYGGRSPVELTVFLTIRPR